jgi:NAD(P)-dependent dehydrogenase (short-subunit alcohol dehydrogenase family)
VTDYTKHPLTAKQSLSRVGVMVSAAQLSTDGSTAALGARFRGSVALVTGASRGIGLAVAKRLVAEGARVCITARKAEGLQDAVAQLGPDVAIAVPGNAADCEHAAAAVRAVVERFGRLDVLVNNAGVSPIYGPLLETSTAAARKMTDLNVFAPLAFVAAAYDAWLGEHGGAVVNVASATGQRPAQGIGWYGITKAGLVQLTAQLAHELAPKVRVNAVAPAIVRTRFARPLFEGKEAEVTSTYPLGRLGEPDDVAAAIAFLASPEASWITGQTLTLDGGLLLTGGV